MKAAGQLGMKNPIVVTHSWSAVPALQFALENPNAFQSMVLVAPWVYPSSSRCRSFSCHKFRSLAAPCSDGAHADQTVIGPISPFGGLRSRARAGRLPARATAICNAGAQARVFAEENTRARKAMFALQTKYEYIGTPTVVLAGRQDRAVPFESHARRLAEQLPNSTLCLLDDAGHELLQTHPDAVVQCIDQAIQMRRQTGSAVTAQEGHLPCEAEAQAWKRARELVYRYGWNATSYRYSIHNTPMVLQRWRSGDRLRFKSTLSRCRGAPVCALERMKDAVREFEAEAAATGQRVCWFGAADRLRVELPEENPHAAIAIGLSRHEPTGMA